MMVIYYRIVDIATHETVADRILDHGHAQETLELYRRDYPHSFFEIETYTKQPLGIVPGIDPDLYND